MNYTPSGYLFITPKNDCKLVVDAIIGTYYTEEMCFSMDFEPEFIKKLMEAGFLVMSAGIELPDNEPIYLLLPKLHIVRSVLFFDNLHVKKSIRKHINRYELRVDVEFDHIVNRCVEKHGDDWLTQPLIDCIKIIRGKNTSSSPLLPTTGAYPASFALYRDGKLVAGEFGVVCGKTYTSYSGYYDEKNAGTVQLVLTTRYLQEHGFLFFDLGMPLEYKTRLGAEDVSSEVFVDLFRNANNIDQA